MADTSPKTDEKVTPEAQSPNPWKKVPIKFKSKYNYGTTNTPLPENFDWNTYIKQQKEEYAKWEQDYWDKNKDELTAQGYTRTVDATNPWESTWTFTPPPPPPPERKEDVVVDDSEKQRQIQEEQEAQKIKEQNAAQQALDQQYYNNTGYTRTLLDDNTYGYRHNVTGTVYMMNGKVKDLTGAMGTISDGKITWENEFVPTRTAPGQQYYRTEMGLHNDAKRLFNESVGGKYTWYRGNDYDKKDPQIKIQILDDPDFPAFLENFKSQYTDNGWMSGWRYKFKSEEDPNLKAREEAWLKFNPRPKYDSPDYKDWSSRFATAKKTGFRKQGGTMNRINYFQQGGQQQAPQQGNEQEQLIALVQAAMAGDPKATETVNQIYAAADAGDSKAKQYKQLIEEIAMALKQQAQQQQGQAPMSRYGSKLQYIKSLKYAKGGKTCPACQAMEKGAEVEMKKCGGKKMKKRYFGGWL